MFLQDLLLYGFRTSVSNRQYYSKPRNNKTFNIGDTKCMSTKTTHPDVQKKRKKVREVIKKLKEKNVKAQSLYPAKLTFLLNTGESFLLTSGGTGDIERTLHR